MVDLILNFRLIIINFIMNLIMRITIIKIYIRFDHYIKFKLYL
jgi:hypothetical protein